MRNVPEKVLNFARKNGLKNIRPHEFWNNPSNKNNYNSYKVYFADYIDDKLGENFILINDKEIRFATEKEYMDIMQVYF